MNYKKITSLSNQKIKELLDIKKKERQGQTFPFSY